VEETPDGVPSEREQADGAVDNVLRLLTSSGTTR